MKRCLVPYCDGALAVDGLCARHAKTGKARRDAAAGGLATAVKTRDRVVVAEAQRITAREAWRRLTSNPTPLNRAVFIAACERAR